MIGNDQLQDARLNKVFISLMLLGSLLGCSSEESVIAEKTIVETFSEDPQALGRGRALFQGSCAGQCHGMEGVEIVEAENLFDCIWQYLGVFGSIQLYLGVFGCIWPYLGVFG